MTSLVQITNIVKFDKAIKGEQNMIVMLEKYVALANLQKFWMKPSETSGTGTGTSRIL